MAIVGPGDDEVSLRDLPRRLEQVVDPFPGSDPSHVQDRRASLRESRVRLAGRRSVGSSSGVGKAVATYVHLLWSKPACNYGLALALATRRRPLPRRARRCGRASRPARASVHLAQAAAGTCRAARRRTELPRSRHHAAAPVVTGSRKPKTCTTSGRGSRASASWERRSDPHPAITERRRQVADGRAVDDTARRSWRRAPRQIERPSS